MGKAGMKCYGKHPSSIKAVIESLIGHIDDVLCSICSYISLATYPAKDDLAMGIYCMHMMEYFEFLIVHAYQQ